MSRFLRRCFTGLALSLTLAGPALACDDLITLDKSQTVDLVNTLRNEEADPLEQFFAFETLMCSDQAGVRDLTLRTAAKSGNETIQSQVVLMAVMEMENIPVRLLEEEGLTKEQYERIKQRPIENMSVSFRDPSKGCLSFVNTKDCARDNVLTVQGKRVFMRTRFNGQGVDGDFELKDGKLQGIFTFTQPGHTYKAEIPLF
jgi:hypothetical protein